MNFFSSDAFLDALSDAFFPGSDAVKGYVSDEDGRQYRVLLKGRDPFHEHFLIDFLEPIQGSGLGSANASILAQAPGRARFLARIATRDIPAVEYDPSLHPSPAPFIRWSDFTGWSAFEADLNKRNKKLVSDTRRQRSRLEREIGPVEFEFEASDARVLLEQTIAWKSRKYRDTLHRDIFADLRVRKVLGSLLESGALTVSSLRVGGTLVATHVGVRWRGRFYYWFPAHDDAFQKFSPGKVLLDHLLRSSFGAGDEEFDFLIGGEDYKFNYATRIRVVESVGRRTGMEALARSLASSLKQALKKSSWTLEMARTIERGFARIFH